jgi:pimeloyl-ACP methyl ester carboxylesterase
MLFERKATAFLGEYLYPFYDLPPDAVSRDDVTEFARTYGGAGGFSGASDLYRAMLAEGDELRSLARSAPLDLPVTAIGSRGREFTLTAFRNVTEHEVRKVQLDGVGHYVAREAPGLLASSLIDVFAATTL